MGLIDELNTYINSKEHSGAFLITGKWGCGKTYQINQFKNNVGSNKLIIVVSLFGINTVDDIEKAIKDQIFDGLFDDNEIIKKVKDYTKKSSKLLSIFSEKAGNIYTNINTGKYDLIRIEKNINFLDKDNGKELIIVFDDFERSKLDVVILLGVINDYCENKRIKVIIVADEEKIECKDENGIDKYKEFKEKVIQSTLRIDSKYDEIINKIIDSFAESISGYKLFLTKNRHSLYHVFVESSYNNLRTIKSILIGFERVFNNFIKHFGENDLLDHLLYSYSAMMFEMKYGNFNKNKYGYLMIDSGLDKKYSFYNKNGTALNTLKKYVYESIFDEEGFQMEVREKYFKKYEDTSLGFLHTDYWGLTSKIINEGLPNCLELAYKGELTLDEYVTLLSYSATLKSMGIELPCEINFKRMIIGLNYKKEQYIDKEEMPRRKHTYVEDKQISILGVEAINFNNKLEKFNDSIEYSLQRKKISNVLNTNCDFKGLYNISVISFDEQLKNEVFTSFVNNDNETKEEIRVWLNKLQLDNQYFSDKEDINISIQNLKELINDITYENAKEKDKITNIVNSRFIETLEDMCKKLEKAED